MILTEVRFSRVSILINKSCFRQFSFLFNLALLLSYTSHQMPLVNDNIVPWPAVKPYDKQAVPVPGTKRPGQTGTYNATIYSASTSTHIGSPTAHYRNGTT